MPVAVVIFCFAALLLTFRKRCGNPTSVTCWREAFLYATLASGILITLFAEILSVPHRLTSEWVLGLWILAGVAAILAYFLVPAQKKLTLQSTSAPFSLSPVWLTIGSLSGAIVLLVALNAVLAPPNNWDSMTYHMARVVHWIQNRSVGYYPTNIERQLYQGPWAEFAIMHLQILSDGDRFANLIQWFSMVGSCVGVSLIAKRLGGDRYVQIVAAILTLTIPMGIAQGSSTQNDHAAAFWLVCLAYFTLASQEEGLEWHYTLAFGVSLSLAILTKPTAYFLGFPFAVWFTLLVLRHFSTSWRHLLLVGCLVLCINAGQFVRNWGLCESPICTGSQSYANEHLSVSNLASNVVRNLSLHAGTGIARVNHLLEDGVHKLHSIAGLDVDDQRTTWPGKHFRVPMATTHEDTAGNPLHLFLMMVSAVVLAIGLLRRNEGSQLALADRQECPHRKRGEILRHAQNLFSTPFRVRVERTLRPFTATTWSLLHDQQNPRGADWLKRKGPTVYYFLASIAGFLLFCLFLRWQPWNSRLHLPWFVLSAPLVAVVLAGRATARRSVLATIAVVAVLCSLPYVLHNSARPLVGTRNVFNTARLEQYFANQPALRDPYSAATQMLASGQCRRVGLYLGGDDWEYPIWALLGMLNPSKHQEFRIEHVAVRDELAKKYSVNPHGAFEPCAVISVGYEENDRIVIGNSAFVPEWSSGEVTVLYPDVASCENPWNGFVAETSEESAMMGSRILVGEVAQAR